LLDTHSIGTIGIEEFTLFLKSMVDATQFLAFQKKDIALAWKQLSGSETYETTTTTNK